MSCACEHKKLGSERDRIRRLAKALAEIEGAIVGIYKRSDGTYGFTTISDDGQPLHADADATGKTIIEFITPY